MPADKNPATPAGANACFTTTHWSVVLEAANADSPGAHEALEKLCRTYWYPLYAYLRRKGHSQEDSQDLAQEFFARLLAKDLLAKADRNLGKFRSYLLGCLENFLRNEWQKAQAIKRGSGQSPVSLDAMEAEERYRLEPAAEETPATLFEKSWARVVLATAQRRLRHEYESSGQVARYEKLKDLLTGSRDQEPYVRIAAILGVSESAVTAIIHRFRRRYGELVRQAIAETVSTASEVDEELRHLLTLAG